MSALRLLWVDEHYQIDEGFLERRLLEHPLEAIDIEYALATDMDPSAVFYMPMYPPKIHHLRLIPCFVNVGRTSLIHYLSPRDELVAIAALK